MGILGIILLLATAGCEGMFMDQTNEPVPQKTEMQKQAPQPPCFCLPTPGQGRGPVSMNAAPAPQPVQVRCIFCIPMQLPINPYNAPNTDQDIPLENPSSNLPNLPFLPKYFHPSSNYQGILPTEFAGPQDFHPLNPSHPVEWSPNMPGLSEGPTNVSPVLSPSSFFPAVLPNYQGPLSHPPGYFPNFSVDSPNSIQPRSPRQPKDIEPIYPTNTDPNNLRPYSHIKPVFINPSQPTSPYGPYNQPFGNSGPPPYPFQLNSLPLGPPNSPRPIYPFDPRPTLYCPPILQIVCGIPVRLNSLAPMCPPGTPSTSYQPCIGRPNNELCPPMLNGMSRPLGSFGGLFGSQVNFGNPMSQLASQINSMANSQSSSYSSQPGDSHVGDPYAGFLPQHQLHSMPSNPPAVPTVLRSLND